MANPEVRTGVIRGKIIELEEEPGLPEGQKVAVEIRPVFESSTWMDRLVVDPAAQPAQLVIKGTRLRAEDVATLMEQGHSDDELLRRFPELTSDELAAVREYAKVPAGLRRSVGCWSDDPEGLEDFLEWNRRQRKISRERVPE